MMTLIAAVALALAAYVAFQERIEPQRKHAAIFAVVQDSIAARLVAPASAKFGEPRINRAPQDRWTVSGFVDSQNTSGAMLRQSYRAEVTEGGGGVLKVLDLQFLNE